jgi:hypothetical protein
MTTAMQCFDSLHYSLLIRDLRGLHFKLKESTEEISQCFSFVLLAGEQIFFCADICLKMLQVNLEFLLELCP